MSDRVKFTICIDSSEIEQEPYDHVQKWFSENSDSIFFKTDDEGCGCCIHMWDVECSQEAADQLPEEYKAYTPTGN